MTTFLGYTCGLECNGHKMFGKMMKVEFNRKESGEVKLTAVSGRNLSETNIAKTITAEAYDDRPREDVKEARWALNLLGFELMIDDYRKQR